MPDHKHIITVDRENEKRLYQILKNLEKDKEYFIKDASSKEWQNTLVNLGIRAKPLIEKGYIEPIWRTARRGCDHRLIRIDKSIIINETNGNKKSFFHFKRRKIV